MPLRWVAHDGSTRPALACAGATLYADEMEGESEAAAAATEEMVGTPLSWSSETEEVIDFRRKMHLLRPTSLAEYEAARVHRQLPTFKEHTPPLDALPPTFKVKATARGPARPLAHCCHCRYHHRCCRCRCRPRLPLPPLLLPLTRGVCNIETRGGGGGGGGGDR